MKSSGVLPAFGRRALLAFGVSTLLFSPASAYVQDPPPAAAAAQEQADPLLFKGDTPMMLINSIKADKVADYEAAWVKIRQYFETTTRPEVKEFAATLSKSWKVDGSQPGQPSIYVFQLDAPSKTFSYNPTPLIYKVLWNDGKEGGISRAEADDLYGKLLPCYASIVPWKLVKGV